MKKQLSILAMLVVFAVILAACGQGGGGAPAPAADPAPAPAAQDDAGAAPADAPAAEGQVTITWFVPNWNEDTGRALAQEFMADNSDVYVDLVITTWDNYRTMVTTAASAANAPELFTILMTDVRPLSNMGLLQRLNDLGAQAGIDFDDFIPAALNITTIGGNIYAVPYRYDGSGIFYNVDILEAAGFTSFPETWDEMIEMGRVLSDGTIHAFAWPLGNQANAVTRLVQQLYTYGGNILNADETASVINSPAAVTALGNIVSSIQDGVASPASMEISNTEMRHMFGSGQLAFNLTGPFDIDVLSQEFPDLNFRTAVIPGPTGMGVTTANGWCIAMGANSVNHEAAARFLAYAILPDNQVRLTESFPASSTTIELPQFSTPHLRPFAQQLQNSMVEPTYTRWAEIEPIIFMYIQQAVSGMMSVEDAIEAMDRDLNALLAF